MIDLSDVLSERDAEVFRQSGYGVRAGFGSRPALLVVDVNYNFCGDKPEPILESIKRWRTSCGAEAWTAADRISRLLDSARDARIPVLYSTGQDLRPDRFDAGRWADKNRRRGERPSQDRGIGNQIIPPIAPRPEDIIIAKAKPSVFFGSLLVSYLTDLQADSIIVCGATTSGCVRATVIDGFSYNYRMSVVEECTFDRAELSHRVSLFEMDQKYADVVSLEEATSFLESLPRTLFEEQMRALRPGATMAART